MQIYIKELDVVYKKTKHKPFNCCVNHSKKLADFFTPILKDRTEENFYVALLDSQNNIVGYQLISRGTLNSTIVHPRDILKAALLTNAASIVLVHNHPSGEFKPSQQDRELTIRIKEACKIMGITLLDHIIIGDGYYSFFDMNDVLK